MDYDTEEYSKRFQEAVRNPRNRLYSFLVNKALSWIATEDYKKLLSGTFKYGMLAATRDTMEGAPPPNEYFEKHLQ